MPAPVKIYDRPADRKSPHLYLIALAVVILLIVGFFIYKMANRPQQATKAPTTGTRGIIFPGHEQGPARFAVSAVSAAV